MNTASDTENCRARLALLGTDLDTLLKADPPAIAANLEKLVLIDLTLALANQGLSPEARAAAANALLKWQRLYLARARLAFDKAKFETAQQQAAEKNQPPFEASLEQQAYIMDKIDYMLGIPVKPRDPATGRVLQPGSQTEGGPLKTEPLKSNKLNSESASDRAAVAPLNSGPPPRFPDPTSAPQASAFPWNPSYAPQANEPPPPGAPPQCFAINIIPNHEW